MREIGKYRGKRVDNGKEVKGWLVKVGERCWIVPKPEVCEPDDISVIHCSIWGFVEVSPETVGEYTGLKDKNGKEICEGDIAKGYGGIAIIKYNDSQEGGGCFHPQFIDDDKDIASDYFYSKERWGYFEVFDDIYDKPELMEQ